jgi:hypothetical protein
VAYTQVDSTELYRLYTLVNADCVPYLDVHYWFGYTIAGRVRIEKE